MKNLIFLLAAMLLLPGITADLIIADGKISSYQIVIPDEGQNEAMTKFLQQSANLLNQCIKRASGANVPVVKESAIVAGKPAIFIGDVKALAASGIDSSKFERWENRIDIVGSNIFLSGNDANPCGEIGSNFTYYVNGSVKAVTVFLQKFVNTAFVYPTANGITVQPMTKITVPREFRFREVPQIQYCTSRAQDMFYSLANNFLPGPWFKDYGGHSHDKAIPQTKYRQSNPEYFALIKGQRLTHSTLPQYCLSNSKVQELIYREVLDQIDKGYEMVQLSQSDGFIPCECDDCKKLYNVESYGEKLWIMHRSMAEKFLKDRPGKMLCISAYGPTRTPPQTFREFPDNVMIRLAPYSTEILKSWQGCKVKNGFMASLYNWGTYQAEGLMPKRGMKFLSAQVKDLIADNIRGIYRCGFGELYGLEGPEYYVWGKLLADPTLDTGKLLKEYCVGAFGNAAETMEKFYRLLDSRLELDIWDNRSDDWNDPELLAGNASAMLDPLRVIALRYPAAVVAEMDELLSRAEKEAGNDKTAWGILPLVRIEFDYLKITAAGVEAFMQFRENQSDDNCDKLLSAIDARNEFITKLPLKPQSQPPRIERLNNLPLFGGAPLSQLEDGGSIRGLLLAPFTWDAKWMRENKIKPSGRIIKTGDEPQMMLQRGFSRMSPTIKNNPVSIKTAWDNKNLYVTFLFGNNTQKEVRDTLIMVFVGKGDQRCFFPGRARNGRTALHRRTLTNEANKGLGDKYEPDGNGGTVIAPAPDAEGASAMISIPWKLTGIKPVKGETIDFNASHQKKSDERYIWNYNIFQKTWRNHNDQTGTLILQ